MVQRKSAEIISGRREKEEHSIRFQAAVMQGAKDIAEGRTTPLTPVLMQELVQSGIDRAKERKKG
jgi:hypothetical protein